MVTASACVFVAMPHRSTVIAHRKNGTRSGVVIVQIQMLSFIRNESLYSGAVARSATRRTARSVSRQMEESDEHVGTDAKVPTGQRA